MTVFLTLLILVIGGALVFRALDTARQEEVAQKVTRAQRTVRTTLDANKDGKVNLKDVTVTVNKTQQAVKKTAKRGRKPK